MDFFANSSSMVLTLENNYVNDKSSLKDSVRYSAVQAFTITLFQEVEMEGKYSVL